MRFRLKMLLCTVWLLTLCYAVGGSLLITRSFARTLDREREAALDSYQMLCKTVQLVNAVDTRRDFQALSATLRQMDASAGWVSVLLMQGEEIIYERGALRTELAQAPEDASHCAICVFSDEDGHFLQISGSLIANEQTVHIDLVSDVSVIYRARSEQLRHYGGIFWLMLIVGGLAAWVVALLLTRPLYRISNASRRMAQGDLSARVRATSRDELGELAADFNYMAEQLDESMRELRQNMQQQERFMASFAHELKTPMTSIIGYADLLRSQTLDADESMNAANYIFSEGRRLEALSLKLLDLLVMKNQQLKLVRAEPQQLISSLAEHLRPVYSQKEIQLQYRCEPGYCMLEPDLVRSLLVNLLDNARKALEESGGNIYIVSDFPDGICRIRVLDNGRGMPEEALQHLTEAFYRVDKARSRAQGGVGLGLTLCHEIAQLHGGAIHFESRIGGGTCVTVLLGGGVS